MQGRSIAFIVFITLTSLIQSTAVAATEGSFWVAHSSGASRVNVADGSIEQHIPTPTSVIAVAIESDSGNVWLLADNTLHSYTQDGELLVSTALPVDGSMLAHLLAVDAGNNTVWAGDMLNLFRLNLAGEMQQAWTIDEGFIWAMDQAADGTLWLAGGDRIWKATAAQGLTDAFSDATLSIFDIAYDTERNALWLAGSHGVALRNTAGAVLADFPEVADALYPYRIEADRTGGAWVAGTDSALRITADDVVGETVTPFESGIYINNLIADQSPGRTWFSAQNRLRRLDTAAMVDTDIMVEGIASFSDATYYRDSIAPQLGFDFPPHGSATSQVRPLVGLSYDDEGDGVDATSLLVEHENQATSFDCEIGESTAECLPETDLAEGVQQLIARIADRAGNIATAVLELVIDTTPPELPDINRIDISFSNGNAIITGQPGSVEAGTRVTIRNLRTGESVTVTAGSDGSFTAELPGEAGDAFEIIVNDAADNASEPVEIGGDELVIPPDPADVAPPLSETAITPFHEAVEFIYAGTNPIQFDVDPEIMEPRRVVVLRGKVMTRDGEPLSGAKVTVNNHPEYGYTVSRADGAYDLAVNGGGHVTVTIEKENFLPSQRTVKTPWRDYVIVDDIALVALDPEVTIINLATLTEIAVAQGSIVQDEDGQRQATILVPPGTSATMTLPDGTQQSLSTINVRATEYTVGDNGPAAMPGDLPPTTAYTYAVELSVDEAIAAGASRVDFSQPLPFYVDNFLDFPVGEVVPLGWYDRERAVWVPADNGKIVEIIDIDANGLAVLDVDGNEIPASDEQLADLDITDDERRNLANLYSIGKSLWRVQIDHFTPWDCNWPYGPPEDAEPPPAEGPEDPDEDKPDAEDDDCEGGCIIEARRRNLGETVPITGTPFTLNYRSNRMPGYAGGRTIEIPLSGESVPSTLKHIELKVNIAGRTFSEIFPAEPDQIKKFVWDGKDSYGRDMEGAFPATIAIYYVYPLQYYAAPTDFTRSFARFGEGDSGGLRVLSQRGDSDVRVKREYKVTLDNGLPDVSIGGWALNVQHHYNAVEKTVQFGDGRTKGAAISKSEIIETVVGTGDIVPIGDGGAATEATVWHPQEVAFGPEGALYIADYAHRRIRRVGFDGVITTIAGKGESGSTGDGGPAIDAPIGYVKQIAFGPDGTLYLIDSISRRVRHIDANGTITTVAGNGAKGDSGDGGPAIHGQLNPSSIAVKSDGTLLIFSNNRIRQVTTDGRISTIAGTGESGFHGDDGLAINAQFYAGLDLAIGNDGEIFIADAGNLRVRRIGTDGIITTVAGNGQDGFSGDGGRAVDARIYPIKLYVAQNGDLYITHAGHNRIRRVSPDGIITTVVGNGLAYFGGDGGYPTEARLYYPRGIAIGPDDALYIADEYNNRIRRVRNTFSPVSFNENIISDIGGRIAHVFNNTGRHLRTIDARTSEILVDFDYDDSGLLRSVTDSSSNSMSIERDDAGMPVAIIAPGGQRTQLVLNSDGYLETVTHPDGSAHEMTYTEGGLLTSFTDPNGHANTFEYDDIGFLLKDVDPANGGWELERIEHEDGYTVTMTSAEGRASDYTIEPLATGNRRQHTVQPDGTQIITEFRTNGETETTRADGTVILARQGPDPRFGTQAPIAESITLETPAGLVNEITQQRTVELTDASDIFSLETQTDVYTLNGKARTVVFDAATRETIETSPEGRASMVRINEKGRPVFMQAGNLAEIAYIYTPEGRIETVTVGEGADARTTTFSYYGSGPSKGWLESVTDAEGRMVTYEYDLAGRVTKQILPDLREIGYSYDANGNLTSITPPGRPAHEFTFTPVDLEDGYTPPDVLPGNDATDYAYNLDKQLELVTLPDGRIVDYVYGATTGKLNEIVIPTGSYGFGYKPGTGQLETLTAPGAEQLTYAYDGFLTTSVSSTGTINGTVSYGYNNDFRMQSLAVNGDAVSFAYDDDGILTTAGSLTLVPDSANGFLDTTSLGVVDTDNDINTFGELDIFTAAIADSDVYSVDYERDKLGRIVTKTETIDGVTTTYDYTYDLAGRLDTVSENGVQTKGYDYDSNGNRTHINGVRVGHYDDQDRLTAYQDCDHTYTANGELDQRNCNGVVLDVTYDVLGNLRSATLPGDITIDYVIDGQNRRVGKKVNGVLTQGFLYQDQLNPVAELDGSGNVVARFVYADKPNVPSYMIKDGNSYRIISDHLGSPRLVIDTATGDIAQRIDYDEWGNVILDTNPGFQPFGFGGGIYDQHTGLVRFGARDYDPETGRWTAKDPLGLAAGTNVYVYVANDPVNLIDPTGLYCLSNAAIGAIAGAIGGFTAGAISGFQATGNPLAALATGALGAGFGAAFGYVGAQSDSQATYQGAAAGLATGLPNPVVGAFAGAMSGSMANELVNSGSSATVAQGMAATVAGGTTNAVYSLYRSGPAAALRGGLRGGAAGLAGGVSQGLAQDLLNRFNDCGCSQ